MSLTKRLSEYVRACFTGIWIESHEHQDALQEIAQMKTWSMAEDTSQNSSRYPQPKSTVSVNG